MGLEMISIGYIMSAPLPPTFWTEPVAEDPYAMEIDAGAPLDEIEPFQQELAAIVDTMKEQMTVEARIIEGTEVPVYGQGEWAVPKNELSDEMHVDEQWKTDLPSGCLTIDRIHTLTPVSNNSSSSVEPSSPPLGIRAFGDMYMKLRTHSLREMSDVSGCVIDATNECSVCTVPTINEPTLGMPNEAK